MNKKEGHPLIEPRYILKSCCLDNIQTFHRRYIIPQYLDTPYQQKDRKWIVHFRLRSYSIN